MDIKDYQYLNFQPKDYTAISHLFDVPDFFATTVESLPGKIKKDYFNYFKKDNIKFDDFVNFFVDYGGCGAEVNFLLSFYIDASKLPSGITNKLGSEATRDLNFRYIKKKINQDRDLSLEFLLLKK